MNDPQWLIAYGTVGLAVATVVLAAITVFQDRIRTWLAKPKLTISVQVSPPDCHKIPLVYQPSMGGVLVSLNYKMAEAYYFRLRIGNKGKTSAKMVEVFAESLQLRRQDGTLEAMNWFLPMNLLWANTNEVYFPSIAPETWKHCGLGHVLDPTERDSVPNERNPDLALAQGQTLFSLELMVKPNTLSHLIPPGSYELTVLVAAENAKPVKKVIDLRLPGTWYPDEVKMLSRGIGLRVL